MERSPVLVVELLIQVLQDPNSQPQAKSEARAELLNLAKRLDSLERQIVYVKGSYH
jgi:hypothetical protein